MAGIYKTVGSRHPRYKVCPICGKDDWCCTYQSEYMDSSVEIVLCNRAAAAKNDIVGSFKCIGVTTNNVPMFVELSQLPSKGNVGTVKSSAYIPPKTTYYEVTRFSDSKLDTMYKKMFSLLKLEDYHEAKLIADGISKEMILHYGIKSFPISDRDRREQNKSSINLKHTQIARELHNTFGDLTGLPGAYIVEYKDRYWTIAGHEGIAFPIPNIYGEVVMCQFRLDNPGTGGKYRVLSSDYKVEQNGKMIDRMPNGCSPSPRIGFIKPFHLADSYVCYITEGIKKAYVAANKFGNYFLSVQGVNNFHELFEKNEHGEVNIDAIKQRYGVGMFIIAYDADKETNQAVQRAESSLANAILDKGFNVGIADWQGQKGIDDYIASGRGIRDMKFRLAKK